MGKINRMSPHLANMIAAGEVVERPCSVVKELVENAIDANATNIQVFLKDGGLTQIMVVDNGEGMDSEDVGLCFLPHATSKIKTEYDLFRISSLGFRGEALASIAAVSTMKIVSSQDGSVGYQVTYKAGVKQSEGVTHSNKGTTVVVDNLFFNTPARLKYLKPAKSELASISYFMDRIALAHPDIRFQLYNDEKNHLSTSASNSEERLIGEIYGFEAAKNILKTEYVSDGYEAKIVLLKPAIYRSNKLEMTLIVNGRYVKNFNIQNAMIQGYATYIPIGKYPVCIVYLTIDSLLIDVNVHPNKTEIKISNEELICERLTLEIKKALSTAFLIPTRTNTEIQPTERYQKNTIFDMPTLALKEEKIEYGIHTEVQSLEVEQQISPVIEESPKEMKPVENSRLPYFEYVGQLSGTYLIFQNSEGMYLLDQHAAAERVNYEKYYDLLGQDNQPKIDLLVPEMISLTKSEAIYLQTHLTDYQSLGFTLEMISEQDFIIRTIPLWAKLEDAEGLIQEILSLLIQNRKVEIINFRDAIAKQISCKSSIKANHALGKLEIDSLIAQLKECKNPFTCPHGRPTFIRFSLIDIEKMFERIQG